MLKDIKYVLNNENGGPNLEHTMGIAIAIVIAILVQKIVKGITSNGGLAETMVSRIASYKAQFS